MPHKGDLMSLLSESVEGLDPLLNRAQMLVYPLFISSYIAELGLGSVLCNTTSPFLGYMSRVAEAGLLLTLMYVAIQFIHRWLSSTKAFGGHLQFKGLIFMFLMPYGLLGLMGSYFKVEAFGHPSLWHVTALAFGFALLQEQRQSRGSTT